MSDVRVGRVIRAVRLQSRLRQRDLADAAGFDRSILTDLEHGRLENVSLRTARRLCDRLEIDLVVEARWRGGSVDRLLDRGHAGIVEHAARALVASGWQVEPELTFNVYGDRGSVDLVGWHQESRALLLVEVKTALTDLQAMLMSMSRKVRVVPGELAERRGWQRRHLGRILVVLGSTANRSVVRHHASMFAASFPATTGDVRSWIRDPAGDVAGIWFVSPVAVNHATVRRSRRVRRA
jgi:transcriptional regulator with XRE-family HTH domain